MAVKTKAYFLLFLLLLTTAWFIYPQKNTTLAKNLAPINTESILVKYQNQQQVTTIEVPGKQNVWSMIKDYQNNPLVEYAEPNFLYQAAVTPNDPQYSNQWYLKKVRASQAWDINHNSPDIVVAVLDTGVQTNHPDLEKNIWINTKEIPYNNIDDDNNGYIDDYQGYDFVNRVGDPSPKFKSGFTEAGVTHGTIIAGILGASGNNHIGVSGVSWNIQIMPLKIMDDQGQTDSGKVIEAINYAVAQGANIINMSFVGYGYSQGVQDAIRQAYDAGVIVVAAGGNERDTGYGHSLDDKPMYPACHDDPNGDNLVIGVAATGPMDQKTYFSSYGSCIDITAPGVSFYSTVPVNEHHMIDNYVFNKYYDGYWSGTSFAVPIVSGTLALMQQANPGLEPRLTTEVLLATADNIDRLNPDFKNELGHGRINIESAVRTAHNLKNVVTKGLVVAQDNLIEIYNFKQELVNDFLVPDWTNINLTSADIDNDGQAEIIASPKNQGQPEVRVYDALGNLKFKFLAYPENFTGGVQVVVADLNNDNQPEIITAPGAGWKPEVKIFDNQGNYLRSFLAYASTFGGGVNLAVGDLDGNGQAEIITAPHSQGGPHIRRFDSQGQLLSQFFALRENYRNGYNVTLTTAFNNLKKNEAKIIVSAGPGINPDARIFDMDGKLIWKIGVYSPHDWGVNITSNDINSDGQAEIITAPINSNSSPIINIYNHQGLLTNSLTLDRVEGSTNLNITTINL